MELKCGDVALDPRSERLQFGNKSAHLSRVSDAHTAAAQLRIVRFHFRLIGMIGDGFFV